MFWAKLAGGLRRWTSGPLGRNVVACFVVLFVAASALAGDLSAVPSAELVRRLGSDNFAERDQAHAELQKRGGKALDALRQGLAGMDLDVRRRALDLVRRIEDGELQDAVIKPDRVRLHFDKMPLKVALREIENISGLQIETQLASGLAGRVVTVDTGAVPFWQAWERFCQAADLCEPSSTRDKPGPGAQLILRQGKSAQPACVCPPLRVRAVSYLQPLPAFDPGTRRDFFTTMLELRTAPHVSLWAIDEVVIRQAHDEDGKPLALADPVALRLPADEPVLLVDAAGQRVRGREAWLIPVRLPDVDPITKLRELGGRITARFLVRQMCVTARLSAAQQTFAGMRGVRLAVQKVEAGAATMTVTLRIEQTSDLLAAGPQAHVQRQSPGVVVTRSPLTALVDGLELHDAKGRALSRASCERLDDAGPGVLCRAVFNDVPGDRKDLQLVLMAWLTVRVDVEFAMRAP
jgi:hypothetical protein